MEKNKFVAEISSPERADKFLAGHNLYKSRSQAKQALDKGLVKVNGKIAKTSTTINAGDEIEISPEIVAAATETPIHFEVVFEDDEILVVNKPAGLLVHRTQNGKQSSLVDALKERTKLSRGYSPDRPGIVHRLDRDTSGLLVVAKTDSAQDNLYAQFHEKSVTRLYLAVTHHALKPDHGTISSYLIRHPSFRTKRVSLRNPRDKKIIRPESVYALKDYVQENNGRLATTHYKVLMTGKNGVALTELSLETGRTHQIRVHLAESGTPIIGDRLYSGIETSFPRCALHAFKLELIHPRTQKKVQFLAPLPEDFKNLLLDSGLKYDIKT